MKNFSKIYMVAVLLAALGTTDAFAHALWIEKNQKGELVARFGEYGEGLREKSGGKLDEITHFEAWTPGAEGKSAVLTPQKIENGFELGTQGSAWVQDVKLPVKDMSKYKLGIAKPHLYARFAGAVGTAKPETRLDILLTGDAQAQVFFDQAPLAKEKAEWIAPNGWSKSFKTDEQGKVKLDLPWAGLYVLEVTHVIEKAGEYEGKPYEVERHRATLSVEKK